MIDATRDTGIEPLGDMPWGSHFCLFYETNKDALDTLVSYFRAGLQSNERCVWVVSGPMALDEAKTALSSVIPDAKQRIADGSIEILPGREWYLQGDRFDMTKVTGGWEQKLATALANGYDGLRVSGNAFWTQTHQWEEFMGYEHEINHWLTGRRMIALCTYPLHRSRAVEILDAGCAHQFTLARRHGVWELVESPELRRAKREVLSLKARLEQRVDERTQELVAANALLEAKYAEHRRVAAALERARARLARAIRLSSISVLAGSIAHEINQPLTGIITNTEASLRWLSNQPPNLERTKAGLAQVVQDANRAADAIKRIRALVTGKAEHIEMDLNDAITEAIALMQTTLQRHRVDIRLELGADLPQFAGDRVQLQQAIVNLVLNGAEAMTEVEGPREITVRSCVDESARVLVSVEDKGCGLSPEVTEHLFEPFFTTKSEGMGLGLSIARSVAEAHGGSLSAAAAPSGGTVFQFTIPWGGP